MSNDARSRHSFRRLPAIAGFFAALLVLFGASPARADDLPWYRRWWLPENFSKHGVAIDMLFTVIFIVTVVVGIVVLFLLARYCIKYRHRASVAKAHFTHGNKKLELVWTIIPTILLLALAVWSKGAWDAFRESPTANDPGRAKIMVIAEQFNWNVIYPGPDGKFGKYLYYPRTTDTKWPTMPPGDETIVDFLKDENYFKAHEPFTLERYPGPAYLPSEDAKKMLNNYVLNKNPLGKDFDDPDGKDDNWAKYPSRPIEIPKGRPVDIILSSKDVIHSFFLPDFRVRLDAVPGMRGHIYLTANSSSADFEKPTRRKYTLDELQTAVDVKFAAPTYRAIVSPDQQKLYTATTTHMETKRVRHGSRVVTEEVPVEETKQIIKEQDELTLERIGDLRKAGIKEVEAYRVKAWDLVCGELCGNSHTTMRGTLIVLEPDEYARKYEGKSLAATAPSVETTAPSAIPAVTSPAAPAPPAPAPPAPAPPASAPAAPRAPAPAPSTEPAALPAVPAAPPTSPAAPPTPATSPTTKPVAPTIGPATAPSTQPSATQPSTGLPPGVGWDHYPTLDELSRGRLSVTPSSAPTAPSTEPAS